MTIENNVLDGALVPHDDDDTIGRPDRPFKQAYFSIVHADEIDVPAGVGVSGSGTSPQLAMWTGVNTIGNATSSTSVPAGAGVGGSLVATNVAAPSSPAAGKDAWFSDSTDLRFHDKNASGTIGTTVVANTGAASNFLTAISAAGIVSRAQPAFSDISGTIDPSQLPPGIGISVLETQVFG